METASAMTFYLETVPEAELCSVKLSMHTRDIGAGFVRSRLPTDRSLHARSGAMSFISVLRAS